jgi:hypothetical protein
MNPQQVINLLQIATNDLQSVEQRYKKLHRSVDYLESRALDANITLEELKSQIQTAKQILDYYYLSCQKEVRKILQLHRQNMRLNNLLRWHSTTSSDIKIDHNRAGQQVPCQTLLPLPE